MPRVGVFKQTKSVGRQGEIEFRDTVRGLDPRSRERSSLGDGVCRGMLRAWICSQRGSCDLISKLGARNRRKQEV